MKITKFSVWKHQNGDYYIVTDTATNAVTLETLVIYQPLKTRYFDMTSNANYARNEKSFLAIFTKVKDSKIPGVQLEVLQRNHWDLLWGKTYPRDAEEIEILCNISQKPLPCSSDPEKRKAYIYEVWEKFIQTIKQKL